MTLKRKTMARAEWTELSHLKLKDMPFACAGLCGRAGLLFMRNIDKPFSVIGADGRTRTIIQNGFSWLQIAPENEKIWATVMFDENGKLFETYFDITLENHVLPEGKSWFIDLLLDVVWIPGEDAEMLDREELDEALTDGTITTGQHENALQTAERVKEEMRKHEREFERFCVELRKELMK